MLFVKRYIIQPLRYSLHHIDRNWDAGDLIEIGDEALDTKRSLLLNYCDIAPSGCGIVMANLRKFSKEKTVSANNQDTGKACYYTFPTSKDIGKFRELGLNLVDKNKMIEKYMHLFSTPELEEELNSVLQKAISQHELDLKKSSKASSESMSSPPVSLESPYLTPFFNGEKVPKYKG